MDQCINRNQQIKKNELLNTSMNESMSKSINEWIN